MKSCKLRVSHSYKTDKEVGIYSLLSTNLNSFFFSLKIFYLFDKKNVLYGLKRSH